MLRSLAAALAAALIMLVNVAEARPLGRVAVDSGQIIGGRPAGCPHAYCGCGASLYLFGRIIPALNLAANWPRLFPRALPAPGMAAARSHHVMVLLAPITGDVWKVRDANSGGGMTWEHARSIRGFVVVDPSSPRAWGLKGWSP